MLISLWLMVSDIVHKSDQIKFQTFNFHANTAFNNKICHITIVT